MTRRPAASEGQPFPSGSGQTAGLPRQGDDTLDVEAVRLVGGQLLTQLLHPAITSFEQLYEALPEIGIHSRDVSPDKPLQFVLGSFDVPSGQALWIMDYTFGALRFSGVDSGSVVPVEDRRLMGLAGFDLTVNGSRLGNLRFQLEPQNVNLSRPQFQPPVASRGQATAQDFNLARTSGFAAASSQGTGLLPPRIEKYGPAQGPFTIVVPEDQRVVLSVVIFRPIPFPIASFEGRVAGFLMGRNLSASLINRERPR